jgi:hypothetical protein
MRALVSLGSRLSTVAGLLILAASLLLRLHLVSAAELTGWLGSVGPAATAGAPSGSPARLATGSPTDGLVAPTTDLPSSTEPPAPTASPPNPAAEILFVDDFADSSVWPVGGIAAGIEASYDGGRYVLSGPAVDLPVYVHAPQGGESRDQAVTAELELGPGDGGAGVFLSEGETRVGAFVFPDGRVVITRDSLVSFDVLGQGSTGPATGAVRLELAIVGGEVSVHVNGELVATTRLTLRIDAFGLGSWFQAGASTASFDRLTIATP